MSEGTHPGDVCPEKPHATDADADSPELGDGAGLWKWLEVRDCE
jgi:hypothetical protein